MKILVSPEDLIRRCVWDHYVYYVLGTEKNCEQIIRNNDEFEISERDALVIGLLKTIETTNLIHKFNTYVIEFLSNKSTNQGKEVLIRKKLVETITDKFLGKFPQYWTPDLEYKRSIEELVIYTEDFKKNIEELELLKITDQFGTHEYLNSNNIKKLLRFNY